MGTDPLMSVSSHLFLLRDMERSRLSLPEVQTTEELRLLGFFCTGSLQLLVTSRVPLKPGKNPRLNGEVPELFVVPSS